MTLPKDPYIVISERLIKAAQTALDEVKAKIKTLYDESTEFEARLKAHQLNLRTYLASPPPAPENGSQGPYADESTITDLLQGLSQWQKLVALGLINNRRVALTPAGRLMHRIGAIGGQ